jgi:hypothetical protein
VPQERRFHVLANVAHDGASLPLARARGLARAPVRWRVRAKIVVMPTIVDRGIARLANRL